MPKRQLIRPESCVWIENEAALAALNELVQDQIGLIGHRSNASLLPGLLCYERLVQGALVKFGETFCCGVAIRRGGFGLAPGAGTGILIRPNDGVLLGSDGEV